MRIHFFSQTTIFAPRSAQRPFEPEGCRNLKAFQKVRGGEFCTLPGGYAPCHEGFHPYRCADGQVIGVQVQSAGAALQPVSSPISSSAALAN